MRQVVFVLFLPSFLTALAQNQNTNTKAVIDSVLSQVASETDNFQKVKTLTSNAGKMRYTLDTRVLIEEAIAISEQKNDAKLLANAYYSFGNFLFFNSELDSAEVYIKKSISYVDDKTMPFLRATNLMTQSVILRKRGKNAEAIAAMLEAQTALDKIDSTSLDTSQKRKYKGESLILDNSLANYYNQMGEFDKALEYYDKAYQASLSLGSFANAGITLSNKGDLLLKRGNYEDALNHFIEGKVLKEKGKVPTRFIMSSLLNIGNANSKLKKYKEALVDLNTVHDYYKNVGMTENLTIAKNYRGNLFYETGQYSLALEDCNSSKILALEIGNLELTSEACDCLSKTYKALGNYEKALENFQMLTKTNDSIFNENNIKKQTQQEMQYEFNKTQALNAVELEAKQRESTLYSYLAILGLVLATTLGFFFYRNRKKNRQLAKQKALLEVTVDEKNILLKETHHRVKNSFQIVSSLLYLQSESVLDNEAKLAIKEAENRVRSMVLIHQKLYNKDELVGINTSDYFSDLIRDLFESHQFKSEPVPYILDVDAVVLDIETITPIGLILNELIINTLKHAFPKTSPDSSIVISFHKKNNVLLLKVIDNGKGFEGEIDSNSFGIVLMKALSKKLHATLNYESNVDSGTIATLTIRKFNEL